jgi:hypothetical protein
MARLGRILATVITIVVGLFILADIFASQWPGAMFGIEGLKEVFRAIGAMLLNWITLILAFALFLGFINVIRVHGSRIRSRASGYFYSIVLLLSLLVTLALGLPAGPNAAPSRFIFDFILQPLEATFFALLAIFIVLAAFRAFRIHSLETLLFALFTVIVLLGQVPLGVYLWAELPVIKDWILNVPTLAGVRGILLGVALGTIATGLRVLMGAERPYTD